MNQGTKKKVSKFDTLRVISESRDGVTLATLREILGGSGDAIKAHIRRLRASGEIQRLAYGVWKRSGEKVSNEPRGHSPNLEVKPEFSLHDCLVSVDVPESERSGLASAILARSEELGTRRMGRHRGLSFVFGGVRCNFFSRRMVLFLSRAHLGLNFEGLAAKVLSDARAVVRSLEGLCRVSLAYPDGYRVWLGRRWHYAKVGDAWARDLRLRSQKLQVPLSKGRLVVDWSDHIDHLEVENGPRAYLDGSVVPFLRGLESMPGFTPQSIMQMHGGQAVLNAQFSQMIRDIIKRLGWSDAP